MAPEPEDEIKDEKNPRPLDEDDIALLKTYVSFRLFKTLITVIDLFRVDLLRFVQCIVRFSLGVYSLNSLFFCYCDFLCA